MMRMPRRWRRIGILAVLLALAWALVARLETWRARGELRLAQQEIAQGHLEAARRRLAPLAARRGTLEGAADYWLGLCEALDGRPDQRPEGAQQLRPGTAALRRPEGGPGEGGPTGAGGRPRLARKGPPGHRGWPMGRGGELAASLPGRRCRSRGLEDLARLGARRRPERRGPGGGAAPRTRASRSGRVAGGAGVALPSGGRHIGGGPSPRSMAAV